MYLLNPNKDYKGIMVVIFPTYTSLREFWFKIIPTFPEGLVTVATKYHIKSSQDTSLLLLIDEEASCMRLHGLKIATVLNPDFIQTPQLVIELRLRLRK